jgi:DHA1 family tetracycline resistance protein-like MFS transporter
VIWTTVALDLVGFGMLFPVLARYSEDLGATPTQAGLLVASFSLAQLVCSPFTGRLSDRIGRKPVLVASLVGTAIGSLLTGLAGSLWLLFLARLLDGASGASVSVAQASVTDVAPREERARLLGLLAAAFGVGFALGPAIGGIAALVSPRLPFFIAAAIAGVNALVALRRLPETLPPDRRRARTSGGYRRTDRIVTADSTAGRGLRGLVLVSFLGLVAFAGFEATFSLLTEERFGLSESATYAVFFALGVGLVLVQGGFVHPVVHRLGEPATIRVGLVCNAVGLVLLAPPEGGWWLLVPALALLVVGQGVLAPTLASAVAARSPERARGESLGIQQAAGGLARVTGPVLAGVLFDRVGPAAPYYVGAGLVTAALLVLGSIEVTPAPEGLSESVTER